MHEQGELRSYRPSISFRPALLAVFLLAGFCAWGGGKPESGYGTETELVTATQHVQVVYRSNQTDWVKIYIDQIDPAQLKGKEPPFKRVANVQLFHTAAKLQGMKDDAAFAKALTSLKKQDSQEIVKFPTPLIVVLRPLSDEDKVADFGMRVGSTPETYDWIIWRSATPAESKKLFLANGFDLEFQPGNPAVLRIKGWPAGDPCMCH